MKVDRPKGVRDLDFNESYLLDYLEKTIEENFKLWGYEKLQLPLLEYYNTHSKSLTQALLNNSFRMVDRYSGEILILRPDFTTQVARYVAGLKEKDFPLRVYYKGDIFRYVVPKADNLYERRQIGIELIGVSEIEADAEVIGVAISSMKGLGVENFQIDINNVKIYHVIRDILKLEDSSFSDLMTFIKGREIYSIKRFLSNFHVDEDLKEFILSIPSLRGGIELIESLLDRFSRVEPLRLAFEELLKIYIILRDYGLEDYIVFDLGEPMDFDYYTGIIFEMFSKDSKKVIGVGGRYDNLLSKYDGDYPATGFAFDLFCLHHILMGKGLAESGKDFYIIDTTDDKKTAYKIATKLRELGFSVARDIVKRDPEESKRVAFKKGFKTVIIVKLEKSERRLYLFSKEGKVEVKSIEDILG